MKKVTANEVVDWAKQFLILADKELTAEEVKEQKNMLLSFKIRRIRPYYHECSMSLRKFEILKFWHAD